MNPDPQAYARNKKLIYIAIALLLGGLLILLLLAISFFYKPKPDPSILLKTPTPTPLGPELSVTPSITVNDDSKLYYIASTNKGSAGQLLTFKTFNQEITIIASGTDYLKLIGFNDDNEWLAFVNDKERISFFNSKTNDIISLNEDQDYVSAFWIDKEKFAIVENDKYKIYTSPDFRKDSELLIPYDQESELIAISKDLKYILAEETGRLERSYIMEIDTEMISYLELYDLGDKVSFNYLNWLDGNRLVFFNSIGLSSLNPKSMVQTRLLSLNIDLESSDLLSNLVQSAAGYNYYFMYNSRLFRYIEGNLLTKQLLDLRDYSFISPLNFAISPNEKYAAFDRSNGSAIVINLGTLNSKPLCDFYCSYPVWEN